MSRSETAVHRFGTLLVLLSLLVAIGPVATADELPAWEVTLDITFPTEPTAAFSDTFDACRSGCSRSHQATDLIGAKHTPLYATTDGRVCRIDEGEEDSYGRHLTLCGDDGNEYRYLHMNNDTPGTDDGLAGLEHVYAPGIARGVRVARGQLLGWMGDSGNAEETVDHLHLDIFVPGVVNPWGESRINPYRSLRAAYDRGDFSDGTAMPTEPHGRIGGATRIETALLVSQRAYDAADHVVVAHAGAPHDALVAGPLAAVLGGPVLITEDDIAPGVLAEIVRLGATKATVVGSVAPDLSPLIELIGVEGVTRIDGGSGAATSVLVAEHIYELTGADGAAVTELEGQPLAADWDAVGDPVLAITDRVDRTGQLQLDGAVVPADLDRFYVTLAGVDVSLVDQVDFFVDGEYVRSESRWPYDLAGSRDDLSPRPVRSDWFEPGEHTVTAVVEGLTGDHLEVVATFTIAGQAAPRGAVLALGSHENANRAWPDALMASWYGAVRGMPVLLTTPDELPAAVAELAATLESVTIAGGPGSIPDAQQVLLEESVATVVRRSGSDRYETAAALAAELLDTGLVATEELFVATGDKWPDAVAAGPAVAEVGGVLTLIDGAAGTSSHARRLVQAVAPGTSRVTALGGPNSVSNDVLRLVAWWAL